VASSPYPDLAAQVKRSAVLTTVDGWCRRRAALLHVLPRAGGRGGFPTSSRDLRAPDVTQVDPPGPALRAAASCRRSAERAEGHRHGRGLPQERRGAPASSTPASGS
jgi:hypothetical protein